MNNRLRRREAAAFLTSEGYPTANSTLAKLASIGGGPKFVKYGRYALYESDDLLAWAKDRAGEKVASTSEYGQAAQCLG